MACCPLTWNVVASFAQEHCQRSTKNSPGTSSSSARWGQATNTKAMLQDNLHCQRGTCSRHLQGTMGLGKHAGPRKGRVIARLYEGIVSPAMQPDTSVMTTERMMRGSVQRSDSLYTDTSSGFACAGRFTACFRLCTCAGESSRAVCCSDRNILGLCQHEMLASAPL